MNVTQVGAKHDMTLHCQSGLDEQFEVNKVIDGTHYCIHGDQEFVFSPWVQI